MARLDRQARRDKYEKPDKTEPALTAEPTENTEATDPAEPMDRIDPAEPMDRIDPLEPMDRIEPLDPMLSSDPVDPAGDRVEVGRAAGRRRQWLALHDHILRSRRRASRRGRTLVLARGSGPAGLLVMEISIPDLEQAAAGGWRAPEEARLGRWLLRAAGGFTGRANSALAIGDPGLPLAAALDQVGRWYQARGLPADGGRPVPAGPAAAHRD